MERDASRVTPRLLTVVEVVRVAPSSCGRHISTSDVFLFSTHRTSVFLLRVKFKTALAKPICYGFQAFGQGSWECIWPIIHQ